jgi:hypothetical protein
VYASSKGFRVRFQSDITDDSRQRFSFNKGRDGSMFEYFPLIVPNFYLNMNHKNEKQKITLSGTSPKESPMEKTY